MKLFARKRLYFLFRKNGQLVRVFLNKPKQLNCNISDINYWRINDDRNMPLRLSGDKLQLWVLLGRKYEFAKEYK